MRSLQLIATFRPAIACSLAFILGCLPVQSYAATIVNKDKQSHTLTFIERKAVRIQQIDAGAKLDGVCDNGCIVRVGKDENAEFQLAGDEAVSIESGLMYYDGEAVKAARPTKPAVKQ